MKTCILITSHLNNQAKIEAAHQQLDSLQDKGYPIIYAGNYAIPTNIQGRVNYTLYTKENPIANRGIVGWQWIPPKVGIGNNQYCMTAYPDYGYAHLYQTLIGFKFAKSLGYNYIIHLNYDILLNNDVWGQLEKEIENKPNIVFKWSKDYATNKYIFNVDNFITIMEKNLHFYKNGNPPGINKDWFCEVFFKWVIERENTPHTISTIETHETINNQTNYSQYGNFRVFHFREKDQLLLQFSTFIENTPHIHLTLDNKLDITFTQSPDKRYYLGPAFEGEYFDGENLLFKLDQQLKERQWVGAR